MKIILPRNRNTTSGHHRHWLKSAHSFVKALKRHRQSLAHRAMFLIQVTVQLHASSLQFSSLGKCCSSAALVGFQKSEQHLHLVDSWNIKSRTLLASKSMEQSFQSSHNPLMHWITYSSIINENQHTPLCDFKSQINNFNNLTKTPQGKHSDFSKTGTAKT